MVWKFWFRDFILLGWCNFSKTQSQAHISGKFIIIKLLREIGRRYIGKIMGALFPGSNGDWWRWGVNQKKWRGAIIRTNNSVITRAFIRPPGQSISQKNLALSPKWRAILHCARYVLSCHTENWRSKVPIAITHWLPLSKFFESRARKLHQYEFCPFVASISIRLEQINLEPSDSKIVFSDNLRWNVD